jgi:RNA polymerase sigma factor (sigma-70 family)|tara:strand:+ start:689 stop:1204 length:516 start_codon:yes stop_codon:yes gene_type:complete
MTPNKQIINLYKKHKQWIRYADSFLSDANMMHSEDVVQECYLKMLLILKKTKDMTINDTYFFNMIRHMILDDKKTVKNPLKHSLPIKDFHIKTYPENNRANVDEIMSDINDLVKTFYHFDELLFNAYRYEFKSIRKLSKATKIGHKQVFQTVKRCKQRINDKLKFKYYGKE